MTLTKKKTINVTKTIIRNAFATDRVETLRRKIMSIDCVSRFLKDDRGEHAIEFLMILTFGVLPLIVAVFLLDDVFQEYVSFSQIFVSSPFF